MKSSYFLTEVSAEDFAKMAAEFNEKNDFAKWQMNFAQTVEFGKMREKLGWKTYFLIFAKEENGEANVRGSSFKFRNDEFGGSRKFLKEAEICGVMVAAQSAGWARRLDIFCGPILDFGDGERVAGFSREIKLFAKKIGASSVSMNPNVIYQIREKSGEVRQPVKQRNCSEGGGEKIGEKCIINLRENGWKWSGLTVKSAQPRFLFVRDLTEESYEQAFAKFDTSAKTAIRRARENGLTIREMARGEIPAIKKIFEETAARQGFRDKNLEYYLALNDSFGEKVKFMVTELDVVKLKENLQAKIENISRKMAREKISAGAKKEFANQKMAAEKRREDIAKLPDVKTGREKIAINAGVFIEMANFGRGNISREMVYLFGGTRDGYMEFGAVYGLLDQMIRECFAKGTSRFNFYGISGVFDSRDPTYGVLKFKQAFGGEIWELVGEFEMVIARGKIFAGKVGAKGKGIARKLLGRN